MMGLLSVRKTKKISGKAGGGEGSDHEGDNGKGASGSPSGTGSSPSNSGNNNDNNNNGPSPSPSSNAYSDNQEVDFSGKSWADRASQDRGQTFGGSDATGETVTGFPVISNLERAYADPLNWNKYPTFTSTLTEIENNPFGLLGGLFGLMTGGIPGALGMAKTASNLDKVTSDDARSVLGGVLGLMGPVGHVANMSVNAIENGAKAINAKNPAPGNNPSPTTDGANNNNFSVAKYNQPKIEYKFDPFGQSSGLLSSNGKISYSQLNRLVDQLRQQTGGLLSKARNTNLGGING